MGAVCGDVAAFAAELRGPQRAGDFEPDDSGRAAHERDAVWRRDCGVQLLLHGGEPGVGILDRSQRCVGDDPGGGDAVVAGVGRACADDRASGDVRVARGIGVRGRRYISCGAGDGCGDAAGGEAILWAGLGI